jgi:hypothetical protein
MKTEREKGMYSEHDHESDHDHSEHGDSSSGRDSAESMHTAESMHSDLPSSAKIEDLATPLTSPANSPPQKTLFLQTDLQSDFTQPLFQTQFTENNLNFYQAYYDRQIVSSNPVLLNLPTAASFAYDELSLGWLDSVALDDTYDLTLPNNNDFTFGL